MEEYIDHIKTNKINNPCFEFLGQVCIYSESGKIPDPIVKEISEICEFYCNHMG